MEINHFFVILIFRFFKLFPQLDVLMKMVLTGMLIYVPEEERAAIAAMLCMVTIKKKKNIIFLGIL